MICNNKVKIILIFQTQMETFNNLFNYLIYNCLHGINKKLWIQKDSTKIKKRTLNSKQVIKILDNQMLNNIQKNFKIS